MLGKRLTRHASMDHPSRRAAVAALLQSLSTRTDDQLAQLVARLESRSWPGGASDRTVPAALTWVRRWGPGRVGPVAVGCSCSTGRCDVCN